MQFQFLGGPRPVAAGGVGTPWLARDSAQVVAQGHGKYTEAVRVGNVYAAATLAAGVAPGTAVATVGAMTLANPINSLVNLVVMRVSAGYVSGTLGAGHVDYAANINPAAAAVSGTSLTTVNCMIGSRGGSGQAYSACTLPAVPSLLRPFFSMGAFLASTAIQGFQIVEDVDGEFIIRPGCALSLCGTSAAGSSPLVAYGMSWEEVPITPS